MMTARGYLKGDEKDRDRWRGAAGRWTRLRRLDFGQNNDGCAPEVARGLEEMITCRGRLSFYQDYPPFGVTALHEAIGERHDVDPDGVIITAGAEQAISMIAGAFLRPGDRVMATAPTFFLFNDVSTRMGSRTVEIPLDESNGLSFDEDTLERFLDLLHESKPRIVWLANPNNPTGRRIPNRFLRKIAAHAEKSDCLTVVDEAYGEYVDAPGGVTSASSWLEELPNLIVLRTFSKAFGLAGLRIGYALTRGREARRALRAQGGNFPVSRISMDAALLALKHLGHIEVTRRRTRERIARLFAELDTIPGISTVPTDCCIYLLCHASLSAGQLIDSLERHGIIAARVPGHSDVGERYIRLTAGTPNDHRALVAALSEIASSIPQETETTKYTFSGFRPTKGDFVAKPFR